ncbi:GH1 family beta-glucosidase [Mangrovimonas sp. YM274]|uniref:GH1 family beta-glucosidase n=1 Tax=Mangrovimonas sp. YM274 TaxID=3070660 RepID=UPI0027DE2EA2|nr:GH1 family beta-glucosidase [Mangrovimonas sp. YM274]WMI67149.1 GH1 family beta-glucosidase [Mangrovimonas sp. YM274]
MKFPKDFVWGSATSSYQIEGAWNTDGRGPSIWDAFCQIPGKVFEGDTGDVACDHYHKMKEDVALMKQMGLTAYRFSISWSRIFPQGRGEINEKGIQFYSELIDELLANDIEPWVTLYHWDLPLALQLEMDGWLNKDITDVFVHYAQLCFERFGDRVKHWITFNEAWVVAILGYGQGVFAPGRISNTEPYLAGHHILIAHAKAVQLYRTKFQKEQEGKIGITNNCDWREPLTDAVEDQKAAQRALEFFLAWFADPIYFGKYPKCMEDRLGDRLPKFTEEERQMLLGSTDFFGLNHYTTMLASEAKQINAGSVYGNGGLSEDQDVNLALDPNWELTEMQWAVVPWGCRKLLHWISDRYDHPNIVITENGCAYDDQIVNGEVNDEKRVEFFKGYLEECAIAIEEGVNLTGYFAWSFMDNFEWASGYSKRFGMHYVDFDTLERTPKASAKWFADFLKQ